MSRKQERSQKAFSSAITLAATDCPRSFYEAGLAHVALLLPVLIFPCKRNLLHYGTSGVFRSSPSKAKRGKNSPPVVGPRQKWSLVPFGRSQAVLMPVGHLPETLSRNCAFLLSRCRLWLGATLRLRSGANVILHFAELRRCT
jgi:hypothetical protein